MILEKSYGAIVYTYKNGQILYTLVQSKSGFWGFPKGHPENSETPEETTIREIKEETGLSAELIPGFKLENFYEFYKNGSKIKKHVTYFLAQYSNQTPKLQESEISSVIVANYNTALNTLTYNSLKAILTNAHEFLIN